MIERRCVEVKATLEERRRDALRAETELVSLGPREPQASRRARVVRQVDATKQLARDDAHGPRFDALAQDLWAKRRASLQRLVALTGKWIVRRRCSTRLARIKQRLGDARTRDEVFTHDT